MSLVARIPDVEGLASTPATRVWSEVSACDLPQWNRILLDSDASLYQYPFWNEPYRPLWLTPHYLSWGFPERPQAFVSILTVGTGPAKIGLVFRGPTCIHSRCARCNVAVTDLLEWARANGYMFIRFTHSDPEVLTRLANSGRAEDFDAFPFFLDYPVLSPDYVARQTESDEETLARFDREVRRKLRRAGELGYEFHSSDSPEALQQDWFLYQECSRRKHFRLERPRSVYMEAVRLARPHNCARVYSLHLNRKLIGSALVFRDRTTAHCQLAAFDAEHRHAGVLLHWRSMRDMYRLGARQYNMGPAPGSLARFKQQFCEVPVAYPAPVTVVLNERLFSVWRKVVYPVARAMRPTLRKIVSHLKS